MRILVAIAFSLTAFAPGIRAQAQPEGAAASGASGALMAGSATIPIRIVTAEDIVSHYVQAMGGREKLQSINSLYFEGKAILPSGLEITTKTWKVYDRLYRQELNFGQGNIVIIATPSRGWMANPKTGGEFKPIAYEDLRALRVQIDPAGVLADYNSKGFRLENAGMDTVNGEVCYKVKVSCPSNHSITYSIDMNNWYLLREVRHGGGLICGSNIGAPWAGNDGNEVVIEYSDYRKNGGGYVLPYSIMVKGIGVPITVQKIEINRNVDVDALSRPRQMTSNGVAAK